MDKMMFQELKKIWRETTKNEKNGRYSMKRLQAWGAFYFAMVLSLADVVEMNVWPEQSFSITKPSVEIIWVWAAIAVGTAALTVAGKVKGIQSQLTENDKEE